MLSVRPCWHRGEVLTVRVHHVTGTSVLGPGDSRFLKSSCSPVVASQTPTPVQSSALGPGDNRILNSSFSNYQRVGLLTPMPYLHPCEFVSNPISWDQCLTASLPRMCRERPESHTRYFGCTPVTLFKNVPTPPARDKVLSTTTTKASTPEWACQRC
ncbi:hypothetical protein PIB30_091769 [Stylosanthes scabra]|uniref:Uncharacterized protein n=1 Tax=Stylosanthes scabra TaxID=79078 RepID=A0ABU6RVL2_9FABA|nr:hypothetical protein [Stylosanthes scabra]